MMLAPWMLDLVMLAVAAEFAGLAWLLYRLRRARWIAPLGWFLLSGALLIGALRLSLSGAPGELTALPLAASFFTHGLMLRAVWMLIR
jgi:hypothetical protein